MVVSALYLLAGCAFYGGAQQLQWSVSPAGRHSAMHMLLAVMWFLLAFLAVSSSLSGHPSAALGIVSTGFLVRFTIVTQFLLWTTLIWLVVTLSGVRTTLAPIILSGAWIFLLFISMRIPLESLGIAMPEGPVQVVPAEAGGWWFMVYFTIFATLIYSLFACYTGYTHGQLASTRILAGTLILVLETSIYDLLIIFRLLPPPAITILGFLGLLVVLSLYFSPKRFLPNRPVMEKPTTRNKNDILSSGLVDTDISRRSTSHVSKRKSSTTKKRSSQPQQSTSRTGDLNKALKEIEIYADMGLRRLDRGATDPQKLAALLKKVRTGASTAMYDLADRKNTRHRKTVAKPDRPKNNSGNA